jgi:Ca2+-binding EF-hand superfamily protein
MSKQIENSDKAWLDSGDSPSADMTAIKEYAYAAFDKLDGNGNGFLERSELFKALSLSSDPKEKSFISFLLNNQDSIAEMVPDENPGPKTGISRDDLEVYFAFVIRLLGG